MLSSKLCRLIKAKMRRVVAHVPSDVKPGLMSGAGAARGQGGRAAQCMREAQHAALAQSGAMRRRAGGHTSMCQELEMMRRAGPGG